MAMTRRGRAFPGYVGKDTVPARGFPARRRHVAQMFHLGIGFLY